MKKLISVISALIIVIICGVTFFTTSSANQYAIDIQQKKIIAEKNTNNQSISPQQQLEKEAALADYVPEEICVPEYFYITAEKLGVDIKGLTPTEIMMKVKEAEAQYAYNQSISPQQQLEKEAALADYVPEVICVPEYFYITAEKLCVDIEGLTPTEIMMKVKEAEVQYALDNSNNK